MLRCLRHIRHSAPLRTVVCQAPLSMGFSRQEYWSGLPCPPPGDLPNPGANPCLWHLLHWQMGSWLLAPPGKPTVWIGEGNAVCFKRFYGLFHIFFGSRSCLFYLREGGSWNQTSGDDRAPGQPSGSHFPLPGGPQSRVLTFPFKVAHFCPTTTSSRRRPGLTFLPLPLPALAVLSLVLGEQLGPSNGAWAGLLISLPASQASPPSSRSARQGCIRARGEDRTALLPPSTIKENIKPWPPPGNCLN